MRTIVGALVFAKVGTSVGTAVKVVGKAVAVVGAAVLVGTLDGKSD